MTVMLKFRNKTNWPPLKDLPEEVNEWIEDHHPACRYLVGDPMPGYRIFTFFEEDLATAFKLRFHELLTNEKN